MSLPFETPAAWQQCKARALIFSDEAFEVAGWGKQPDLKNVFSTRIVTHGQWYRYAPEAGKDEDALLLAHDGQFQDLCAELEEENPFLYPVIYRTRSTDWIAEIYNSPEHKESRKHLASGQGQTMDVACALCVADFYERARIEARKAELMEDPQVREALKLFGAKID